LHEKGCCVKQKIVKTIKISIGLLIVCVYYLLTPVFVLLRKNERKINILCYHGVADDYVADFKSQMKILKYIGTVIPLENVRQPIEKVKKRRHIFAVTFDENAVPTCEEFSIPYSIFVPTDYVGRKCEWMRTEKELSEQERKKINNRDLLQLRNDRVMNLEELIDLKNKKVNIGSHGVTHTNLDFKSDNEMIDEITVSRKWLRDTLSVTAGILSLPRGRYNQAVLNEAKKAGYENVLSIIPFKNRIGPECPFLLGRVVVDPNDGMLEFIVKCLGGYTWLSIGKVR
jgi:peptidoglycan/xylan/chitin deacetylase (PgdA/CDA1 family)